MTETATSASPGACPSESGNTAGADRPPLVSVIIPAYNAARFIGQTLESATSQTYANLEIVVIDDGSTDKTAEIVAEAAKRDPRIRLLRQANSGVARARNRAISVARGEFIAPLDADDLWRPEKIERQVARMLECGAKTALVYCWLTRIDELGTYVVKERTVEPASFEGDVFTLLILQNFVGCGSVPLIRRRCVEQAGGYDPTLRTQHAEGCEDRDLYLKLAESCEFAIVPMVLVGYRLVPGSMSRAPDTMRRSYQKVINSVRSRHDELPASLFRWSHARSNCWLATRAVLDARLRPALWLGLQAVWLDPLLLFTAGFRYLLLLSIQTILHGLGIAPPLVRRPLAQWAASGSLIRPGRATERRRRYVASLQVVRSSGAQNAEAPKSAPAVEAAHPSGFPSSCSLSGNSARRSGAR